MWRAAQDNGVTSGTCLAEDRAVAEAYLDNPGFGGSRLYRAEVQVAGDEVLDLVGLGTEAALDALVRASGLPHPGAIGADEWAPQIAHHLADRGVAWVKVEESYPADTLTWVWTGIPGRWDLDDAMVEAE